MVLNSRKSTVAKRRTLITYSNPESIISEQFRTIQTNINFSIEKNGRIFLITSPGEGEGKSTTAANLAVSMSQQNERVLIIDANLRNPSIHSFFQLPNRNGLVEMLTEKTTFENAVQHTKIGNLDILSSGIIPNNPVELVGSFSMKELLKYTSKLYDVILVDTTALLGVTDTMLLVRNCDGVVLVVQNGKTKLEQVKEVKKELDFAKANLIGVVFNQ